MKIAFFGQRTYFDYFRIGGFESYIRRLAEGLAQLGHEVHYILYNSPQEKVVEATGGLHLFYCLSFDQGLTRLWEGNYQHVFRVRLARKDYLKYLWGIYRNGGGTRWHQCFLGWPDSYFKRRLIILEGCLASLRGKSICVSLRQYLTISKITKHACLLLPPVPEEYFLTPEEKDRHDRINVTFLGNLTQDKYIGDVITMFEKLGGDHRFRVTIYGTHDSFNPDAVEMHNRLARQKEITYVHVEMEGYSPDIDTMVRKVLQETDVFVQPYRTLKNTLDTPLLLLEAMAALCAVITTPLGNVPDIYGGSPFLLPAGGFSEKAYDLLQRLTQEDLLTERKRVFQRNRELGFQQAAVLKKLLAVLEN